MADLAHPGENADFLDNIKRCPLKWFVHQQNPTIQKGLVIHHANTNQCYGKAITTDANDNIIAAELFQTNINGKSFTSAGIIDGLFSKYDRNGNLIWDKTAGGANCITTPHGVETDAAGNVFVTGYFGQTANTTGRTISFDTKTITSKSDYDVFLAKYNSAGSIQWALALGNPTGVTEERAWDIAVDATGNSYICGAFAYYLLSKCNTLVATLITHELLWDATQRYPARPTLPVDLNKIALTLLPRWLRRYLIASAPA